MPAACSRFFLQEYGIKVSNGAIQTVIRAHRLRYKPRLSTRPPKSEEHIRKLLVAAGEPAEPACPLKGRVDYAPDDEEPGDWKGIYRPVAMAWSMPRRGES